MPWKSVDEAKKAGMMTEMDGAPLSLDQINKMAEVADAMMKGGKMDKETAYKMAVAKMKKMKQGGAAKEGEPVKGKYNVHEALCLKEGSIIPDTEENGQKTRSNRAWWPLLKVGPGNARDKNFYTVKALESLAERVMLRPKMFFDHIAGDVRPTERNVKDWGASVKETKIENNTLFGLVQAYDPWLTERMYSAPDELAASIEARGKASGKIEHNGEQWNAIESVPWLNAVNIVDYPGNAPMGIALTEGAADEDEPPEETMKTTAELKEKNPDLYALVETEIRTAAQADFDAKLKEKADKIVALEADLKTIKESAGDPKATNEKIAMLTAEVAGLKAADTVRGKKTMAERIVKESGIPAQAISPELVSLVEAAADEAGMKAIVAVYAKPFADKVFGHGKTEDKPPAESLKEREAIMMGALGVKIEEKKPDDKK